MSQSKSNNVGEIDISFYLNADSRFIFKTSQNDQIVLVNYSYLFISVSDSQSGILLELMQTAMDIIRESSVVFDVSLPTRAV